MSQAKNDAQILVDEFMPFAIKMLTEYREFLPYGGHMKSSGEIVHQGASNGEERPKSINLINILRESNLERAKKLEIKASCIVYDTSLESFADIEQDNAIAFELDHKDEQAEVANPLWRFFSLAFTQL